MSSVINQLNFRFGELVKVSRKNQIIHEQSIVDFKNFIKALRVEKEYSFWENIIEPMDDEQKMNCSPEAEKILEELRELRPEKMDMYYDKALNPGLNKLVIKENLLIRKLCSLFVVNEAYFFYNKYVEGENLIFFSWSGYEPADEVLSQAIIESNSAFDKKHLDFLLLPVKI